MTAPVNPEGQTAREPKAEWRVIGAEGERTAAICTPDGDEVAEVYGNAAHLETAYQRAVAICAARNAGQTAQEAHAKGCAFLTSSPLSGDEGALCSCGKEQRDFEKWSAAQEVRRAVNDGRQSAYVHVLALVASCLRAAEDEDRALASTPSPAKQTEQKIASAEGRVSNPVARGSTEQEDGNANCSSAVQLARNPLLDRHSPEGAAGPGDGGQPGGSAGGGAALQEVRGRAQGQDRPRYVESVRGADVAAASAEGAALKSGAAPAPLEWCEKHECPREVCGNYQHQAPAETAGQKEGR